MKLIFGIALVLGLMMLGEGITPGVMIALMIAFAVRLAPRGAAHWPQIAFAAHKSHKRKEVRGISREPFEGDTREAVSGRGMPLEEPPSPHRQLQGPVSRDER
jgi:hypothetical protein